MRATVLLVSLSAAIAGAGESPKVNPVRFPAAAVATPAPQGGVITLSPGEVYVIDSDVELMTKCYGKGKLKIESESGPITFRTKFVGGNGSPLERKTFTGKYVTSITADGDGVVTLVIVPVGAKSTSEWIEKEFKVTATGANPIEPKTPVTPPPAESELRKALSAAWQLESEGTNEQLAKLITAFRECAKLTEKTSIISRKQLAAESNRIANLAVTSDGLTKVRRAAGDWLNKNVGQSDVALDAELRAAYKDAYSAVAEALETLK